MTDTIAEELRDKFQSLDFHHPYTPYDVQLEFMKTAYAVLQTGNGQVGILESPTGTGKSLSLICAALTWLRNYKSSEHETSLQVTGDEFKDEPEWVIDQFLKRKRDELARKWEEREERLEKLRQKEKALESRSNKRRRTEKDTMTGSSKEVDEDAEWMLDYGDEGADSQTADVFSGLSTEAKEVLARIGLGPLGNRDDDIETTLDDTVKIYYTSRTHSQLTQFISELRRPSFPTSLPKSITAATGKDTENAKEPVKHIPLSSRQRLCINHKVSKLGSLAAINDRCAELQKPKSGDRCDFIPKEDNLAQTHQFRDTALATLPDIEDLFNLGKTLAVCPYYASRTAIPGAEIVTLPYPLLLQQSAREALGIELKGNVVIIDEAHNIMDAIANVYAAKIKLSELRRGRALLGVYIKRFGKKLKGENRVRVAQIARVIDAMSDWLEEAMKNKHEEGTVTAPSLLQRKGGDLVNIYDLVRYIHDSKLAYKVEGYAAQAEGEAADSKAAQASPTPVLHILVSFLAVLANPSREGRIFYEKLPGPSQDIQLSYQLLSPTFAFSSIALSARAVILAGGTMSPFDDYKAHLFPTHPDAKITTLSCGHVIPSTNLCVWTLTGSKPKGTNDNAEFEFSFQKRSDQHMVHRLGLAILNMCGVVPDGVVVFFPSYGYLDQVVSIWQNPGSDAKSLWERLQARKAVFRETKGGSSEEILQQYSDTILGPSSDGSAQPRGALLLSVVGGKMSEGINFSDRLGRCVVVVGLPYPNINSQEWKAKIEYIESSFRDRLNASVGSPTKQNIATPSQPEASKQQVDAMAKQVARDFYENACMRAVNQSIGRAIRHRSDYAAIVLVDRRYGTERIRGKLPGWIRGGMVGGSEEQGLPQLMAALSGFFRSKKSADG